MTADVNREQLRAQVEALLAANVTGSAKVDLRQVLALLDSEQAALTRAEKAEAERDEARRDVDYLLGTQSHLLANREDRMRETRDARSALAAAQADLAASGRTSQNLAAGLEDLHARLAASQAEVEQLRGALDELRGKLRTEAEALRQVDPQRTGRTDVGLRHSAVAEVLEEWAASSPDTKTPDEGTTCEHGLIASHELDDGSPARDNSFCPGPDTETPDETRGRMHRAADCRCTPFGLDPACTGLSTANATNAEAPDEGSGR